MADEKSRKRNFIEISSSEESESVSESESSPRESDEDFVEITSSSSLCSDDDDDDDDDDEDDAGASEWIDSEDEEDDEAEVDEDGDCVDEDDVESMCNKVVQMIRGRSDLEELKLVECKAYLRRHDLRLSGTKDECIERIKEHRRLKNGNGETVYPRSSFVVDCTGDVCKGDVVLFNQKVHQILNKRTRSKNLRRRTVAGRIVKGKLRCCQTATYFHGRANFDLGLEEIQIKKFNHTEGNTVEVLWSKGATKLDPLTPLLVKGRNLYKMKTYRQRWKNEKERLEVLDEKHKRGAAARTIRAMRHKKVATKKEKYPAYKGAKCRKHFHHLGPSRTSETIHDKNNCRNEHWKMLAKDKKRDPRFHHVGPSRTRETIHEKKCLNERRKALAKNKKWDPHLSSKHFQTSSSKQNSHRRHQNLIQSNQVREPQFLPYNIPSQRFHHFQPDVFPRELDHFPSHRGPTFTPKLPYPHPLHDSVPKPIPNWNIDPRYSHSTNSHIPRNLNYYPRVMDDHPSYFSSTTDDVDGDSMVSICCKCTLCFQGFD